jgi:PRTRC genetic system protein B
MTNIPNNSRVSTEKALLFHKLKYEPLLFDGTYASPEYRVTVHDVHNYDDGTHIGVGKLVSESDMEFINAALSTPSSDASSWIPENLLLKDARNIVWFVPAKKRLMYFNLNSKQYSYEVIWPSLVFHATPNDKLFITAYAGTSRPSKKTRLYHAPLWNIYAGTDLCVGSGDIPTAFNYSSMKTWEDSVFNTNFSHSNHINYLRINTNYLSLIKNKSRTSKPFLAKEMAPLNINLEQWVSRNRVD